MAQAQVRTCNIITNLYQPGSLSSWKEFTEVHSKMNIELQQEGSKLSALNFRAIYLPIQQYLEQYNTLMTRCEERNKRRELMDKYISERNFLQNHHRATSITAMNLEIAEVKVKYAITSYTVLNDELKSDMSKLLASRESFLDTVVKQLMTNQVAFFSQIHNSLASLEGGLVSPVQGEFSVPMQDLSGIITADKDSMCALYDSPVDPTASSSRSASIVHSPKERRNSL